MCCLFIQVNEKVPRFIGSFRQLLLLLSSSQILREVTLKILLATSSLVDTTSAGSKVHERNCVKIQLGSRSVK